MYYSSLLLPSPGSSEPLLTLEMRTERPAWILICAIWNSDSNLAAGFMFIPSIFSEP